MHRDISRGGGISSTSIEPIQGPEYYQSQADWSTEWGHLPQEAENTMWHIVAHPNNILSFIK